MIFPNFLFIFSTLLATTIAAVRTPSLIIISSDSKATYRGTSGSATVCKIYQSDQIFFAIGGLEHDSSRAFSPKMLVANSFKSANSFAAGLRGMEEAIDMALLKELQLLKAEDPETYKWTLENNSPLVLSILVAEIRDGVPYSAGRGFRFVPEPTPKIEVDRLTCPGNDCPNGELALYIGKHEDPQKYIGDTARLSSGPIELTKRLVENDIQAFPGSVGPPIVTLRIDANGASWLSNESGCPVVVP